MRLAVFSDVHGNLTALEAVLADISKRAVDKIVFAGDLCLVGPRPAECLDRVRDLDGVPGFGCTAVYGNTDDWLLGRQQPPPPLADLAQWTYDQLSHSQRKWLDDLPFAHTVSASGSDDRPLLIVHANPQDVNQLIFPPEEEQIQLYGRVRQADDELNDVLQGVQANTIIFGHLHIPSIRSWDGKTLYNISSVSMPGDGDPRAKYGLFTWDNDAWQFERIYVRYEWAVESAAYRTRQPPGWQKQVETITAQGYISQNV
ncbi:MAG: metallophosphoesterase family protein [Candidatus Promineifilaceae bacterium]|jgi:predicted phosphodiesterase